MFIHQALDDLANIMPSAAAGLSGVIDQLQKVIGTSLAKGATPPPAQGPPTGGMMMSPTGGMGGAPTS